MWISQSDPGRSNSSQKWEECLGISPGRERSVGWCSYRPRSRNIQSRFSRSEMFLWENIIVRDETFSKVPTQPSSSRSRSRWWEQEGRSRSSCWGKNKSNNEREFSGSAPGWRPSAVRFWTSGPLHRRQYWRNVEINTVRILIFWLTFLLTSQIGKSLFIRNWDNLS